MTGEPASSPSFYVAAQQQGGIDGALTRLATTNRTAYEVFDTAGRLSRYAVESLARGYSRSWENRWRS